MGSQVGSIWEDPEGEVYQIRGKKSFKTRPNTTYGGETTRYSLLQGGVISYYSTLHTMKTLFRNKRLK